jgi:RNA recognition motif-containing protein
VHIPKKPDGAPRGFGFIQFESLAAAQTAITKLNSTKIDGIHSFPFPPASSPLLLC